MKNSSWENKPESRWRQRSKTFQENPVLVYKNLTDLVSIKPPAISPRRSQSKETAPHSPGGVCSLSHPGPCTSYFLCNTLLLPAPPNLPLLWGPPWHTALLAPKRSDALGDRLLRRPGVPAETDSASLTRRFTPHPARTTHRVKTTFI